MKWILILSMFVSCNALKVLTDGKTIIPDDFGDFSSSFAPDTYTFFDCNLGSGIRPCMFSTATETTVELDSTITSGKEFFPYKGNIIFTGFDGVWNTYRYELSSGITYIIESGDNSSYTELNGFLYYLHPGTDVFKVLSYTNWTPINFYGFATLASNTHWIKASSSGSTKKLFYCYNSGPHKIFELIPDNISNPTGATILAVDPAGASTVFPCTQTTKEKNGIFIHDDTAGPVMTYNTITSVDTSYAIGGGATNTLGIGLWGKYFFQSFNGSDYDLYRFDFQNNIAPIIIQNGNFDPNNLIRAHETPDGEIFFIDKDASGQDQIFVTSANSGVVIQRSELPNVGLSVLNAMPGKKGIYLIMANGEIWRNSTDFGFETYSVSAQNNGFVFFSESEINN
jgi:hypothetical protein